MRTGVRGTTRELVEAARRLRREQTPAEEALWVALRARQREGVKFRRQHAVGPFVLDFFCPQHKLVVEVDGGMHDDSQQQAHDAELTAQLEAVGYTVLRFRNEQVLTHMPSVLAEILVHCRKDVSGLRWTRVRGERAITTWARGEDERLHRSNPHSRPLSQHWERGAWFGGWLRSAGPYTIVLHLGSSRRGHQVPVFPLFLRKAQSNHT